MSGQFLRVFDAINTNIPEWCRLEAAPNPDNSEAVKPSHNIDYTAVLRSEIEKCDSEHRWFLHASEVIELATRLNSAIKALQNCQ